MPGPVRTRPPWAGHGGRHGPPWQHEPPEWRPPRWVTLWVPVLVSFLIQVPVAFAVARFHQLSAQDAVSGILIALAGPLLLIGARRFPGPVVAAVAAVAVLDLFAGDRSGPPYVALAFAIVSAIVRGARLWAWISIAVAWVGAVTLAAVLARDDWTPFRIVGTTLGILIVFGIGESIRSRRERIAEFRRRAGERRQSAVQQERVRIARELHDVLAHSLSQINVQAGVGLHLLDSQPEKARDALASIKETSRSALDEVRSVLGVLRADGSGDAPRAPEPDLDRLPDLVAGIRAGGLRVELDDRLDHAGIPAPVQLAVYRIVQESLTNAARHAEGASHVDVRLERRGGELHLEVRDDGHGTVQRTSSGGRGLLGMRERAELLGGRLGAGPAPEGGFAVTAVLPIPHDDRDGEAL